jgi:hypothetical protein
MTRLRSRYRDRKVGGCAFRLLAALALSAPALPACSSSADHPYYDRIIEAWWATGDRLAKEFAQ